MATTLTSGPRRYQPTPDECRRGGRAAAAKLTRAPRRLGGLRRSQQPSFIDLQRRRGRRGAQVVLARYGPAEVGTRNAERGTNATPSGWVGGVLDSFRIRTSAFRVRQSQGRSTGMTRNAT